MCSVGAAAAALLTAYSANQQSSAQKKARQDQQRIAQQQRQAQIRSIQLENSQRQREIAGQSSRSEQIQAALGGSAENAQRIQQQVVEATKEKTDAQLKGLAVNEELTGDKLEQRLSAAAGAKEDSFNEDIAQSEASGLQEAGSGVAGNVSDSFTSANEGAKEASVLRAQGLAKDTALLGGYGDVQFDENQLVNDANVQTGLASNAANARIRGADLLRNAQQQQTQAALTGADLSALVAPQKTELFDIDSVGDYSSYTDRAAIAQGLAGYAPYLNGLGGGATTTPQSQIYRHPPQ